MTSNQYFDNDFITVGFLICKQVLVHPDQGIMRPLFVRVNKNFNQLSPQDLAFACENSSLLSDKESTSREIKDEFFNKLEEYIYQN